MCYKYRGQFIGETDNQLLPLISKMSTLAKMQDFNSLSLMLFPGNYDIYFGSSGGLALIRIQLKYCGTPGNQTANAMLR